MQNEEDVAAQLVGFFQQFLDVFSELKGLNFYLTGESVSVFLSFPLFLYSVSVTDSIFFFDLNSMPERTFPVSG